MCQISISVCKVFDKVRQEELVNRGRLLLQSISHTKKNNIVLGNFKKSIQQVFSQVEPELRKWGFGTGKVNANVSTGCASSLHSPACWLARLVI